MSATSIAAKLLFSKITGVSFILKVAPEFILIPISLLLAFKLLTAKLVPLPVISTPTVFPVILMLPPVNVEFAIFNLLSYLLL